MSFRFYPLRFRFAARDEIHFRPGQAANMLRGSLGAALKKISSTPECSGAYERLFAPRASEGGPSGLRDWPRPFVLRTAHLEALSVAAGAEFHIGLNLFDLRPGAIPALEAAFGQLFRAKLIGVDGGDELLALSLDPDAEPVRRVVVRFLTPTELKGDGATAGSPPFAVLAARLRDRVSTLRTLYGGGPLEIDFRGFGERAAQIRMERCEIHEVSAQRRSRHTGQTHSLGGFVGQAEYAGDLAEFVPYLRAGRFTGVGRQTVWGKGEIDVEVLS